MTQQELQILYEQADNHRVQHGCSAHPYKYGWELWQELQKFEAKSIKSILELGTGYGYASVLFAKAFPNASLISIEKDPEHIKVAKKFFNQQMVTDRVELVNQTAEDCLPILPQEKFDLIFFDGYQVHYQHFAEFKRVLKSSGILVLANNHLQSKTSDKVFEELNDAKNWQLVKRFGDTTIALKTNSL